MAAIMGLDLSLTGTGIVVMHNGTILESCRIETKLKNVGRLLVIEETIHGKLLKHTPTLTVIEGYAFSRPNQAHQIGELGGVIRRLLWIESFPYIEVAPAAVKKFATGKGNAQKELILQQVYKRWGVEFKTSDEADAYVLAQIGQVFISGEKDGLTAFQVEVMDKLKKGA